MIHNSPELTVIPASVDSPHENNHSQSAMDCPRCHSSSLRKYGFFNETQRYQCKECGRYFLANYTVLGYPSIIKQQCINMYLNGKSFRAIERETGIHHTTVINWVRETQTVFS